MPHWLGKDIIGQYIPSNAGYSPSETPKARNSAPQGMCRAQLMIPPVSHRG